MNIEQFQKDVDSWVSCYDPAYFPPLEILANMYEEKEELSIAIDLHQNILEIESELVDVLFSTICMANAHTYSLLNYELLEPLEKKPLDYLRTAIMAVSRKILRMYGNKKEKPTDNLFSLDVAVKHVIHAIDVLAKEFSIDIEKAWKKRFHQRTTRDKNRFQKTK